MSNFCCGRREAGSDLAVRGSWFLPDKHDHFWTGIFGLRSKDEMQLEFHAIIVAGKIGLVFAIEQRW
ncbi:MAG: hypothetical protein L6461_19985 [Anaerolineae bacterium]|nr:hypothetical protein [Anaerolineae bacterium]